MAGTLQPLGSNFKIVNPDGTPTDYFIKWAQQRQIDITSSVTQAVLDAAIAEVNAHTVNAGTGLAGGGAIATNPTLSLNAGLDLLTDVDITTNPPTDGQALIWNDTDSEWVPGDVASGGGGGITLIQEVVTTASASSVTFSSIPNTYRHLKLMITARGTNASNDVGCQLRFNGDTGNNYDYQQFFVNGGSTAGVRSTSQSQLRFLQIAAANAAANVWDSGEYTIGDYASTTHFRSCFGIGSNHDTDLRLLTYSGRWKNAAAAISSIVVSPTAGNFVDGSKLQLYGIS